MTLSVVLYKNLGLSNAHIALLTSWLYLPWVVKPLWSPVVALIGAERRWVVALQFAMGALLAALALALPLADGVRLSLALFWLLAFASATHDIAADGFYLQALPHDAQAAFVGVRSLFYRLAMILGQGGLVVLAGELSDQFGSPLRGWQWSFALLAVAFGAIAAWHLAVLPRPAATRPAPPATSSPAASVWAGFVEVLASFFRQPGIGRILAFLLLYRLAESQLLKLVTPFLLDAPSAGGLGLRTQDVGVAYGTLGVAALTVGGLLGGWLISRHGLDRWIWPMVAALNLPNIVYVALAWWQPSHLAWVSAAIAIEQFGYGLGFAGFLVALMMIAEAHGNPHKTAHYALCTGFMALGMMLPGMGAGWLQERLGYTGFFIWVCVATLPSFAATGLLRVVPGFGRKDDSAQA